MFDRYFREADEVIPRGTEMYRAPSAGQVSPSQYSQSVPYPTRPDAEYIPDRIQSAAGSGDLQRLGEIIAGQSMGTGGRQNYAPGMAMITAMEDLPGIRNINEFLSRYSDVLPDAAVSDFSNEYLLSPHVRYILRNYTPGQGDVPPAWYFEAYRR